MTATFGGDHTAPQSSGGDKRILNEFHDSPNYDAGTTTQQPVFDPLKAPPYELQNFDPKAAQSAQVGEDERGRSRVDRNPAGATGARSVSRNRTEEAEESLAARGRADNDANIRRDRIQSPSRAMGARSVSIDRTTVPPAISEEEPYRGAHSVTGARSHEMQIEQEERGRLREAGPPSMGQMGLATGGRSPSATRSR